MRKFISLLVIFCFVASLMGCATSSRYIANSGPPDQFGNSSKYAVKDKNLSVRLVYLVIPNSRGSFVKDAPWDEYGVEIKNISKRDVLIKGVYLIDPRGVYIQRGSDIYSLARMTESLSDSYKEAGIAVVAGAGAAGATTLFALAGAGALIIPLSLAAAVGAPLYLMYRGQKKAEDKEKIEAEFKKRNLPLPMGIEKGGKISGSIFFPIVPAPKALVVEYAFDQTGKSQYLKLPLGGFGGLHIKK